MLKDRLDIDTPGANFGDETLDLTDAARNGNLLDETLVAAMQALKLGTGLPSPSSALLKEFAIRSARG